MRLATVARIMPVHGAGGMQIITERLLRGIAACGVQVELFTTDRPGQTAETEVADEDGVRVRYLRTGAPGRYSAAWFRALDRELRRAAGPTGFDAMLSISAGARGLIPGWRRDGVARRHMVVTFGTHLDEFRAALHSIRGDVTPAGVAGGVLRAGHVVYRAVRDIPFMRSPDVVVASCPADVRKLARTFLLPARQIAVIPYGVERADRERLAEVGTPGSGLLTLVARLERDKGVQVALRALTILRQRLPQVRLRIAGDGAYRPNLEELAARLGVADRVEFLGTVPFEQIERAYAGAAVVLNPRLRPTAYDHAMILGMATGLPLIGTNIGDVEFVATPDVEALFVPPGDPVALAGAIERCVTDQELAARIGATGAAKVEARFSMEATVARYLELLQQP